MTASYAAMGRTGPEAVKEMGALLQVFMGGTKSSAEAATTFTAVMRELVAKESQLGSLGVEIWDPEQLAQGKKVARAVPEILTELIKETEGDISQLSKVFGEEAAKGIKVLITEYQKAGNLPFDKYMKISGDGAMLMEDSTRMSKTFGAALQNLYGIWQKFADESLTGPVKTLADLLNSIKPEQVQTAMKALTAGVVTIGGVIAGKKIFKRGRRGPAAGQGSQERRPGRGPGRGRRRRPGRRGGPARGRDQLAGRPGRRRVRF